MKARDWWRSRTPEMRLILYFRVNLERGAEVHALRDLWLKRQARLMFRRARPGLDVEADFRDAHALLAKLDARIAVAQVEADAGHRRYAALEKCAPDYRSSVDPPRPGCLTYDELDTLDTLDNRLVDARERGGPRLP